MIYLLITSYKLKHTTHRNTILMSCDAKMDKSLDVGSPTDYLYFAILMGLIVDWALGLVVFCQKRSKGGMIVIFIKVVSSPLNIFVCVIDFFITKLCLSLSFIDYSINSLNSFCFLDPSYSWFYWALFSDLLKYLNMFSIIVGYSWSYLMMTSGY